MNRTLGLALGVALSSIASAGAVEQSTMQSAFGPGEQMTYRVNYLGVTAGTATITVGAEMRQWGRQVWPVVTVAQTESLAAIYPIRERFITYWDFASHRSIGSDQFAEENRRKRRQRIRLLGDGKAEVTRQKQGEEEVFKTHEVDPNALDVASAALVLRNYPLTVGKELELPVFTGGRSFTMRAKVESRQTIQTRAGPREALKVRVATEFSGKLASKRDMHVYFSADQSRIPIKLEAELIIGSLVAELVDYKQGRSLASLPPFKDKG
jgi:hypothetical protein